MKQVLGGVLIYTVMTMVVFPIIHEDNEPLTSTLIMALITSAVILFIILASITGMFLLMGDL